MSKAIPVSKPGAQRGGRVKVFTDKLMGGISAFCPCKAKGNRLIPLGLSFLTYKTGPLCTSWICCCNGPTRKYGVWGLAPTILAPSVFTGSFKTNFNFPSDILHARYQCLWDRMFSNSTFCGSLASVKHNHGHNLQEPDH